MSCAPVAARCAVRACGCATPTARAGAGRNGKPRTCVKSKTLRDVPFIMYEQIYGDAAIRYDMWREDIDNI